MSGLSIQGDKKLIRKLERMADRKVKTITRKAVSAALTPINKDAKRSAPKETGQLKKSIGRKLKTYKSGVVYGAVGPRKGFKNPETGRNPINYAHLVEYGTINIKPRPFMRTAWDKNKTRAQSIMTKMIRQGIEKEARKKR